MRTNIEIDDKLMDDALKAGPCIANWSASRRVIHLL